MLLVQTSFSRKISVFWDLPSYFFQLLQIVLLKVDFYNIFGWHVVVLVSVSNWFLFAAQRPKKVLVCPKAHLLCFFVTHICCWAWLFFWDPLLVKRQKRLEKVTFMFVVYGVHVYQEGSFLSSLKTQVLTFRGSFLHHHFRCFFWTKFHFNLQNWPLYFSFLFFSRRLYVRFCCLSVRCDFFCQVTGLRWKKEISSPEMVKTRSFFQEAQPVELDGVSFYIFLIWVRSCRSWLLNKKIKETKAFFFRSRDIKWKTFKAVNTQSFFP